MSASTSPIALAESFFVFGYVATCVATRPDPKDRSFFGGDLSRPFRQTMVLVSILNITRNLFLTDRRFLDCNTGTMNDPACRDVTMTWLYYISVGSESFVMSFLKLLTPFLLQRKMREYINIRPGEGLLVWLYATLLLDLSGIVLSSNVSQNYWALKRLGDCLCGIPAIQIITQYRRIMSRSPEGQNSGNMCFLQTVLYMEYWAVGMIFMASVGYWSDQHHLDSATLDTQIWDNMWRAIRISSIFVSHVKAFMHALMLTMIDETEFLLKQQPENSVPFAKSYTKEQPEDSSSNTTLLLTENGDDPSNVSLVSRKSSFV